MNNNYDVIIIGGSYAGLSAAMALGRSLRHVLVIDSGKPCNRQTPHSHNMLTHDGDTPQAITAAAKEQVLKYDTVHFHEGLAVEGNKKGDNFEIKTGTGEVFSAKKLVLATGLKDIFTMKGLAECWGITALHCPYCHGYEVRNEPIGVISNGDIGFEFTKLIYNWSKTLTLFTDGASTLTAEQSGKIKSRGINIAEKEIAELVHTDGQLKSILFKDGSSTEVAAVFARPAFQQHSDIPQQLGCELTEQGFIKVDEMQRTTVPGVYAAGDNSTMMRSVAAAIGAGNKAGAVLNKELIEEEF
jgi:thioredoxin reductase